MVSRGQEREAFMAGAMAVLDRYGGLIDELERGGRALSRVGMVSGMATKKYTVTLPEELAEEIRREVGPGGFSAYVTHAIERQRERDRLGELVAWMQEEGGPLTGEEMAEAEAERRELERYFAEREAGPGSGNSGSDLPMAG